MPESKNGPDARTGIHEDDRDVRFQPEMSDADEAAQAEVDFVDNENPFGSQAKEILNTDAFFEDEYDGEQGPELAAMHELTEE